jgi:DNA ligase D-like protein (predicted ligase)
VAPVPPAHDTHTAVGLLDQLPDHERDLTRQAAQPRWVAPMLATLTHDPFSDADWIYERKLDGERCLAFKQGGEVRLRSRNRQHLEAPYPELVEALAAQRADDFVIDGEVVAFTDGLTSFSRLQGRMQKDDPEAARATGIAIYYYVFDILHLEDHDVTRLPLRRRKRLLRQLFDWQDPLRFTTHRNQHGEEYLADACRRGWEGLIAKDARAHYVHTRSRKWLKFRCSKSQELVIGGFTDPRGERAGLGALLVGFHREGELRYAGKVGTGFDDDTLRTLRRRLGQRERTTPPFAGGKLPTEGVHWVRPDLVAEVAFTEWTREHRLRHPRYLGLRPDKDAGEVTKEEPA